MRTGLIALLALLTLGLVLTAQSVTSHGIYKSAADILAGMKTATLAGAGQSVTIVPNLVIRRRSASEPNNASVHPDVTEIYEPTAGD